VMNNSLNSKKLNNIDPKHLKINKSQIILKFIEDGQHWDVEEQERLWIFSFLPLQEFFNCLQHDLEGQKIVNYLRQFWCGKTKDPLWTLYLNGEENLLQQLSEEQIFDCGPSFDKEQVDSSQLKSDFAFSRSLYYLLKKEGFDLATHIFSDGSTPLHLFASKRNEDAINFLFSQGAQIISQRISANFIGDECAKFIQECFEKSTSNK